MEEQRQDRFWEVMDPYGFKHVVCAARAVRFDSTDRLEFISASGQMVAVFDSFAWAKAIADAAQADEPARDSDNLEALVAAAVAELAQGARPCPGLTPYEAVMGFAGWLSCRDEPVTFSARHDAAHAAELVDLFCRANQIDQELSEHWPDHLRHPKEADAKGNSGYPAPDAHASTTACGCGQESDPSTVAGIKARLDRIEAEQARHRDRLAQHREWFERSKAEGQRRGWLKGAAFRLFGGGVV